MIVKEFRELVRDRRTLGMLIVLPLLLLVIFGYAANFYVSSLKTAVVGPQASQVAAQLPSFFNVTVTQSSGTKADAETLLQDNKVDVAFVTGQTPVLALVNGSNLFAAQAAEAALGKAGHQVTTAVGRKEVEAALKKGAFDLVVLGPTLTRNDRHHLPYVVKKGHEGTRVLVLHADGGRHPYVDAATDTGRTIEQILETISSMMAQQATGAAR